MPCRTATLAISTFIATTIIVGCKENVETSILPENIELREGDVVLRRGGGATSMAVLMAEGNGEYSHIGIVADSAGTKMIVHAVPGEPDFEGDVDRVKMETPRKFFSSSNAKRGCLLRCTDNEAAKRAAREALAIYQRTTLFDHDYDDTDTTRMYCCELTERAYTLAGCPLVGQGRHDIRLPAFSFDHLVLPSDFLDSPHLQKIAEF